MTANNLFLGIKAGFLRNAVGSVTDDTAAAARNATYVDSSVLFGSNASAIGDFSDDTGAAASAVAGDVFWMRMDAYGSGGSGVSDYCILLNGSDQQLFRVRQTSNTAIQLMYNSGTLAVPVWTNVGSTIAKTSGSRNTLVIELTIDAGGNHTVSAYLNNVLALSPTAFTMTLLTTINAIMIGGIASGQNMFASQVFCAVNRNLVGSFVPSLAATAAGANTAWTGTYTDVNEAVGSDATMVSSATAGQKETNAMADVVVPSGNSIQGAIRHTFRAKNSGIAPNNIKPVIREAGVDTSGANISGITNTFKPFVVPYVKTAAEINAAGFELGWESAT